MRNRNIFFLNLLLVSPSFLSPVRHEQPAALLSSQAQSAHEITTREKGGPGDGKGEKNERKWWKQSLYLRN